MRLLLLTALLPLMFGATSCTSDPDLDPQPKTPPTATRQNPWNTPISGQGGGAMGALPKTPRR